MWRALAAIGEQVPDDVRVVVVRGSGQSFSAGLDRAMLDPGAVRRRGDRGRAAGAVRRGGVGAPSRSSSAGSPGCATRGSSRSRWSRATPIGAGFQLALSCDLRVLADDAQLCMKESALGLVPDLTGTQPLVEAVGYARALEICATARDGLGRGGDGDRAGQRRWCPVAELDATVADLVAALTAPLPGAVRETKALLLAATGRTLDEQRRFEREAQVRRFRELAAMLEG